MLYHEHLRFFLMKFIYGTLGVILILLQSNILIHKMSFCFFVFQLERI